jgi:hypothetical protein
MEYTSSSERPGGPAHDGQNFTLVAPQSGRREPKPVREYVQDMRDRQRRLGRARAETVLAPDVDNRLVTFCQETGMKRGEAIAFLIQKGLEMPAIPVQQAFTLANS